MRVKSRVILAETPTLFYACRKSDPSTVRIFGYKKHFKIAAFPAKHTARVLRALKNPFPDFEAERNVLVLGMSNCNITDHPPPILLNAGWVERTKGGFLFYEQGVTNSIAKVIDALDRERLAIGRAMGMPPTPMRDLLLLWYGHLGAKGGTTLEVLNGNPAYQGSEAPRSLFHPASWFPGTFSGDLIGFLFKSGVEDAPHGRKLFDGVGISKPCELGVGHG